MLLSLDAKDVVFFAANRHDEDNHTLPIHIIEDAERPDSEFPGRQRVGPEFFAVAGWHGRLMSQLLLDGVKNNSPIASTQLAQMPLSLFGEFDFVTHSRPRTELVARPSVTSSAPPGPPPAGPSARGTANT